MLAHFGSRIPVLRDEIIAWKCAFMRTQPFLALTKLVESSAAPGLCLSALIWILGTISLSGCANWKGDPTNSGSQLLSAPKMTPDSVVVEAVSLRFPLEAQAELAAIWDVLDESTLDLKVRQRLDENGLRCGILVGELPKIVRARMEELAGGKSEGTLEGLGLEAEVSSDTRRMQCHAGKRKDLHVRTDWSDSLTIVYRRDGQLQGASYDRPNLLFDMRALPHHHGQVKMKFTPEVQYGDRQHSIAFSNHGLRNKFERKKHTFDELAFETVMIPGQILICTATEDAHTIGVGHAFFHARTVQQTEERVLLLVRMLGSQLDELFDPEQTEQAKLAAERSL